MKWLGYLVATFLFLCCLYVLFVLIAPPIVEKRMNKVQVAPPYTVDQSIRQFYDDIPFIADLHCDALLWNRFLSKRYDYGHVDIPRMQESNMALQTFSIVTKSPEGQNMMKNRSDSRDRLTNLFIGQGAPIATWSSLYERAAFQCRKLHVYQSEEFSIIKNKSDLLSLIQRRKMDPQITSGLLAIEGLHCLEGKLENVDRLYDEGVRMMAATHFFDNEMGGSAHGISGEGLTPFGIEVIRRMNERNIIIDLAHVSPKMINDILRISTQPVLVSHTGIKATFDSPRNLSDQHIKAIAEGNGLIGIAFFEGAIGSLEIKDIVNTMKYVKDLVGVHHVALGSDFDGSVTTPFDVTGLPLLVEEMMQQEFTEDDIRAIMGGNFKEFLLRTLPEE